MTIGILSHPLFCTVSSAAIDSRRSVLRPPRASEIVSCVYCSVRYSDTSFPANPVAPQTTISYGLFVCDISVESEFYLSVTQLSYRDSVSTIQVVSYCELLRGQPLDPEPGVSSRGLVRHTRHIIGLMIFNGVVGHGRVVHRPRYLPSQLQLPVLHLRECVGTKHSSVLLCSQPVLCDTDTSATVSMVLTATDVTLNPILHSTSTIRDAARIV
jgi:hypothetical protein